MSTHRYPEEFKIEAVKQVCEHGFRVAEVAQRIGVSQHRLYTWIKKYDKPDNSGKTKVISRLNCDDCGKT